VIAVAAASGAMAVAMPAYADADAGAEGAAAGSPGVVAGNIVQLPVHAPLNVCGNTVNVVGLLNPAAGNTCVNDSAGERGGPSGSSGGASADSGSYGSPGVASGNEVQLPVDLPVNVSGNSVNVVGVGNAAVGNESVNTSGTKPVRPATPVRPVKPAPERSAPPRTQPEPAPRTAPRETAALAETGADRTVPVLATGAALVLGGVVLYRRVRPRADG
jgi:hypothetical protein